MTTCFGRAWPSSRQSPFTINNNNKEKTCTLDRVLLRGTAYCCVVLCIVCFVLIYVLFVCKYVLPPGDNPIAVNKYIISY